jgi:hypothetical protein
MFRDAETVQQALNDAKSPFGIDICQESDLTNVDPDYWDLMLKVLKNAQNRAVSSYGHYNIGV